MLQKVLKSNASHLLAKLNPSKEAPEVDDIDYDDLMKEFDVDVDALEMIPTVVYPIFQIKTNNLQRTASKGELRNVVIINLRELIHLKRLLHEKSHQEIPPIKPVEASEESQKMTLKLQKAIRMYEKKLANLSDKSVLESGIQTDQMYAFNDCSHHQGFYARKGFVLLSSNEQGSQIQIAGTGGAKSQVDGSAKE